MFGVSFLSANPFVERPLRNKSLPEANRQEKVKHTSAHSIYSGIYHTVKQNTCELMLARTHFAENNRTIYSEIPSIQSLPI